ncbi:MAG TPA: hypothetical protein VFN37_07635 [Candidatus Baltobacteraceae bacterium]|nr:hypothetical protein [Candidatus Baltobacteraceae bacterium]
MTWIYAIPAWLFMSACVAGSCALACGLLAVVRKHMTRNEQITHNDVAGPILTIIGTVLAVMMSFMTVGVWQEYDSAAQTAQQEASALSDLHHLADAFPPAVQRVVKAEVDRYILLVVNQEWPAMRRGGESAAAHDTAYQIQGTLNHWRAASASEQALQARALDLTGTFLDRRRDRILANRQGIPIALWATMLFIGAVTVVFSFYFRVDRPQAQFLMVIAETAVITIIFTLIAELDFPFRGDIAVDPYSFMHVINALHGIVNGT